MTREGAERIILRAHASFREKLARLSTGARSTMADAMRELAHDVMAIDLSRATAIEDVADMVSPSRVFAAAPPVSTRDEAPPSSSLPPDNEGDEALLERRGRMLLRGGS